MDYSRLRRKLIKGWFTLAQLKCKHADIMVLKQQGSRINMRNFDGKRWYSIPTEAENTSMLISGKTKKAQHVKWLELSDLHAGSLQFDRDGLFQILEKAQEMGIEDVHISGDLCDGWKVYPGHITNLRYFKAEDQADELAEILAEFPFRYIACTGNHDFSFVKQGGQNPVAMVERRVPNFHFLEAFAGDLIICGVVKRMIHGASGRTYAKSYPGQTYIRDLLDSQGEHVYVHGNKYRLRFLQIGHYHSFLTYESAGVWVTHSGNFQFPNEYTTRRGLVGSQGGRIVNAVIQNGKVLEFWSRFIKPKR